MNLVRWKAFTPMVLQLLLISGFASRLDANAPPCRCEEIVKEFPLSTVHGDVVLSITGESTFFGSHYLDPGSEWNPVDPMVPGRRLISTQICMASPSDDRAPYRAIAIPVVGFLGKAPSPEELQTGEEDGLILVTFSANADKIERDRDTCIHKFVVPGSANSNSYVIEESAEPPTSSDHVAYWYSWVMSQPSGGTQSSGVTFGSQQWDGWSNSRLFASSRYWTHSVRSPSSRTLSLFVHDRDQQCGSPNLDDAAGADYYHNSSGSNPETHVDVIVYPTEVMPELDSIDLLRRPITLTHHQGTDSVLEAFRHYLARTSPNGNDMVELQGGHFSMSSHWAEVDADIQWSVCENGYHVANTTANTKIKTKSKSVSGGLKAEIPIKKVFKLEGAVGGSTTWQTLTKSGVEITIPYEVAGFPHLRVRPIPIVETRFYEYTGRIARLNPTATVIAVGSEDDPIVCAEITTRVGSGVAYTHCSTASTCGLSRPGVLHGF